MFDRVFIFFFLSTVFVDAVKLKVTNIHSGDNNDLYIDFDASQGKIVPVNENYNRIDLTWKVLKDFPKNVKMNVEIYRLQVETNHVDVIGNFNSTICNKNDPYHKYLPSFVLQLTKGGKCIKKGNYHFSDAGQFRYDLLLKPEEFLDGYTYVVLHTFFAEGATIDDLLLIRRTWVYSKIVEGKSGGKSTKNSSTSGSNSDSDSDSSD